MKLSRAFRRLKLRLSIKMRRLWCAASGRDWVTGVRLKRGLDVERIGTGYGGWTIPRGAVGKDAVCYCVGVGEDTSFDLGLIRKFGCEVFAFDPTPRAIEHVLTNYQDEMRFHFAPVGLWDQEAVLMFYAPADLSHVSHSVVNLQNTRTGFEAECRRLSTIMEAHGHLRLDLLKLDIEGAEYRVIDSILDDDLDVGVLCVEFDELTMPVDRAYKSRIRRAVFRLKNVGYEVAAIDGSNYTFVKSIQSQSISQTS